MTPKKLVLVALALALLLSLSACDYFAPGNQRFMGETQEESYKNNVGRVEYGDYTYWHKLDALSLEETPGAVVEGYKTVAVPDPFTGEIVGYYRLHAMFEYDGVEATCIYFDYTQLDFLKSSGPYRFSMVLEQRGRSGNVGYVEIWYNVFQVVDGEERCIDTCMYMPTIACEPCGEIY